MKFVLVLSAMLASSMSFSSDISKVNFGPNNAITAEFRWGEPLIVFMRSPEQLRDYMNIFDDGFLVTRASKLSKEDSEQTLKDSALQILGLNLIGRYLCERNILGSLLYFLPNGYVCFDKVIAHYILTKDKVAVVFSDKGKKGLGTAEMNINTLEVSWTPAAHNFICN